MSELQRPGPCKVCDGGGDASSHCVGVQIGGDKVRHLCPQLRAMWDAGHAAGVAQEREAQAVDAEEASGKEWV